MNLNDFDGITHINIYSKSKTILGRSLSHFSEFGFCVDNNQFRTLEGYFYYNLLSIHFNEKNIIPSAFKQFLLNSKGSDVKKTMKIFFKENSKEIDFKKLKTIKQSQEFKSKILKGLEERLKQNKELEDLLFKNDLDFEHYYVFEKENKTIIVDKKKEFEYIIDFYKRYKKENLW